MNMTDKSALRKWAGEQRRAIEPAWRAQAEAKAAAAAIQLIERKNARTVALFASFGDEIDTHGLIQELMARGIEVALPLVVRGEKRIEMRRVASFPGDCRPGAYGILEPDPERTDVVDVNALDLIFVPGLLFTREGWRLGYGGGYYDKLLAEKPRALTAGYCFSNQMMDELPHESWDRPVDVVVTEKGIEPKRST